MTVFFVIDFDAALVPLKQNKRMKSVVTVCHRHTVIRSYHHTQQPMNQEKDTLSNEMQEQYIKTLKALQVRRYFHTSATPSGQMLLTATWLSGTKDTTCRLQRFSSTQRPVLLTRTTKTIPDLQNLIARSWGICRSSQSLAVP